MSTNPGVARGRSRSGESRASTLDPMPPPRQSRPEFPYLDGLRGTAALVVVAYHAFLFTGHTGDAEAAMPVWGIVIGFGYVGVAVFIVLSGYVLMLPVATTPELRFRGGTWRFVKRRAKRILPPYYAALFFALLLIGIFPVMQTPSDTAWDSKIPVTLAGFLSHLLLVQDFSPEWIFQINGPLWSVAIEWQIYFVMALILVPLWRRVPAAAIVGALVAVTLLPAFIGVGALIHPWFVALFAAGMWAAQLTLAEKPPRHLGLMAILLVASVPAAMVTSMLLGIDNGGLTETAAGLAVAAALVWVGRREVEGKSNPLANPFRSRPMMFLGLISYSVYLFHSPLLGLFNLLTMPLGLPTVAQYLLLTFVGIPIAVAFSWAMFWLVERHFLNTRQKHAQQELTDAAPIPTAEDVPTEAVDEPAGSEPTAPRPT